MLEMNKTLNKFYGEKNGKSKLTDEQIKDMLFVLSLNKFSVREVAKMYAIHISNVYRIINGQRRKSGTVEIIKLRR